VKEGTLDTASVLDPSRRQLYFRAVDKDHLEYWGSGTFSPPSMECVPGVDLGGPNGLPDLYFSLAELSSGSGAPDAGGNTCAHTTWQIDTTAATITGSCFGSKYDDSVKQHSVKYEWNLTRTGPAPGS
jgi:hypothetical protein